MSLQTKTQNEDVACHLQDPALILSLRSKTLVSELGRSMSFAGSSTDPVTAN